MQSILAKECHTGSDGDNKPADREIAEAEAARLLQLHQSTLHYWLEGREMRGRHYQPIIRPVPTGGRTVTWAEFIEASAAPWLPQQKGADDGATRVH